jgi:hypothetical protein
VGELELEYFFKNYIFSILTILDQIKKTYEIAMQSESPPLILE